MIERLVFWCSHMTPRFNRREGSNERIYILHLRCVAQTIDKHGNAITHEEQVGDSSSYAHGNSMTGDALLILKAANYLTHDANATRTLRVDVLNMSDGYMNCRILIAHKEY